MAYLEMDKEGFICAIALSRGDIDMEFGDRSFSKQARERLDKITDEELKQIARGFCEGVFGSGGWEILNQVTCAALGIKEE